MGSEMCIRDSIASKMADAVLEGKQGEQMADEEAPAAEAEDEF